MVKNITIPLKEYNFLKQKANSNEKLLISLVQGLEDIKAGRLKLWRDFKKELKL